MRKQWDYSLAGAFVTLTVVFVLLLIYSSAFFDFMWARHHNLLSWYVRPLMFLPFCYFAYKRLLGGMALAIFATATSMAWFPAPQSPSPQAAEFLRAEYEFLHATPPPLLALALLAVVTVYVLLGIAFYRRSFALGIAVVVASGASKVAWSFLEGGGSGWALVPAAAVGTGVCALCFLLVGGYLKKRAGHEERRQR